MEDEQTPYRSARPLSPHIVGRFDGVARNGCMGFVDELRDIRGLHHPIGLVGSACFGRPIYGAGHLGATSLLPFCMPNGYAL